MGREVTGSGLGGRMNEWSDREVSGDEINDFQAFKCGLESARIIG